MNSKLLSIQEVSKKLNVPKPSLRYWEKRFQGILVPVRTEGGQRRYSIEQLAIVEQIILLKKEGKSLSEIEEKLQSNAISGTNDLYAIPIDVLTDRITEVVRAEIFNYLKIIESGSSTQEVTKP